MLQKYYKKVRPLADESKIKIGQGKEKRFTFDTKFLIIQWCYLFEIKIPQVLKDDHYYLM